ncbi:NADH2 dehydrogenase [Rickenella mellea]|uniref:NADH2 dehydrogenase n=1 Tax=Rickenella mellea TaxID=50990 RepID=A0A4Y7QLE6_9AGAM|nr:NADH2 dehydrogenase [Rickenella mellea]
MLRLSRPLFQHALRTTTGVTGLARHSNPLPALEDTFRSTLSRLANIPESSVYRQSVQALTERKLDIVQKASGDVDAAEKALDEGQIEEVLGVAQDELILIGKMIDWKAWEPLEEHHQPGQWQ